jgi:hypothetical protein
MLGPVNSKIEGLMTQNSRPSRVETVTHDSVAADQSAPCQLQRSGSSRSTALVTVDRRDAVDRRGGLLKAFLYGNFHPRRRNSRRQTETHFYWFDWHEPRVLYLALGILLLSCTDALFTLNLLEAGAGEANSLMASMLASGMDNFVVGKIWITSLSVVILVGVARRRFVGPFSVEHLLQTIFAGYVLLICYELFMFWYVFEISLSPAWLKPNSDS